MKDKYVEKIFKQIKKVINNDEEESDKEQELCNIINKIYNDGFSDGVDESNKK